MEINDHSKSKAMNTSYMEKFYPESKYGGFTDIDGTIAFYSRVNSLIEPHYVVLDVGCGKGSHAKDPVAIRRDLRIFKGKAKKVIGIDVDKAAEGNPYIDEFYLLSEERWPLNNDSVDIIICDNVLEHVVDPVRFFLEKSRVLKNGGYLCIRTANVYNYVAWFSKIVPEKYHSKVLKRVQEKREKEDVFPTLYRCSSISKIRTMMHKHGYEYVVYGYEAEPSYMSFSKVAYLVGVLHQRLAPNVLKPAIFAFGKLSK